MNRLVLSALLSLLVLSLGCEFESEREAAQRKREAELEENLEGLLDAFADAMEEAGDSDSSDYDFGELSPIAKVVREAEGLNEEFFSEYSATAEGDYGNFSEASDMILELIENHSKEELMPYRRDINSILYNGACAYSLSKDVDKALSTLKLAVDYGWNDHAHTLVDPDLENLRATAGFKKFNAEYSETIERQAGENIPEEVSFPFDFKLTGIDGEPVSLADHKGKVVIVDFWGTWCPPCRAEIPSFIRLQNEFGEEGFQMIGLNYEGGDTDSDTAKVKQYVASEGINYPCALGDDATQNQVPGFNGYPTTLFIDKTGKVRHRLVGLHQYQDLSVIVKKLLAE